MEYDFSIEVSYRGGILVPAHVQLTVRGVLFDVGKLIGKDQIQMTCFWRVPLVWINAAFPRDNGAV